MFFIDIQILVSDEFDEERIDVLVGFIGMDVLWVIDRAYPWVVVAADEVLDEVATVVPPERR